MPDQVPEAVKKERSEKLLALGHRMSEEFRRYYLGRQVTALLEEEFLYDGKRYYTGYTKVCESGGRDKKTFQHVCDGHLKRHN